MGLWPVGLWGSEPIREQQEGSIGGVPPLMKEAFWSWDLELLAKAAKDGTGEQVERIWTVSEEEGLEFDGQELKQAMDGRNDNGGIVCAENDGGLEMNSNEWDAKFFPDQSGAEGSNRGEDEVGSAVRGGVGSKRVVKDLGRLGSVFEDGFGAGAKFPDAGIAHEDFEVGILANGDEGDAGGVGGLFEEAGGDEQGLVTVLAEVPGEPDKGQDVTGRAEGEEGDFQKRGRFEFEEVEKQGRRRAPWRLDLTARSKLCNGFTACSS